MEIAVLIPCLNEESTIGQVISDFKKALPVAKIYVGDNDSTDKTAEIARSMNVAIIYENRRGKGSIVKALLNTVTADLYVLVDGDGTYRAQDLPKLLQPVQEGRCDMCIGNRLYQYQPGAFSSLHLFGNKLIRILTKKLHGVDIPDMLTGYRVMSRKLVDEICLIMGGFEIETEINIKSVWHGFQVCSVDIEYGNRPEGSASKIRTLNDGYRILSTILMLLREHQPMTMGGVCFLILNLIALILFISGVVSGNLFSFCFALFLSLLGAVAFSTGIILHAGNIAHRESEVFQRKLNQKT